MGNKKCEKQKKIISQTLIFAIWLFSKSGKIQVKFAKIAKLNVLKVKDTGRTPLTTSGALIVIPFQFSVAFHTENSQLFCRAYWVEID